MTDVNPNLPTPGLPAAIASVDQITPNVVVSNPNTRRKIGVGFWIASLLAGAAGLLFAFFPEIAMGTDVPTRAVALVNSLVSLGTGAFGFALVMPNTPSVPNPPASRF
ncbi:MAG: hypothetical protein K0S70_107 [Microbacterium sp.]|jgi:hypothetical protein|nr:hypothetical protein [Microbacterium sp.]